MIFTSDGEQYIFANLSRKDEVFNIYLAGITNPNPAYKVSHNWDGNIWDWYSFEYICSGKGYIETPEQRYTVEKGDMIFLNRMTKYTLTSDQKQPYMKYFLVVNGQLPDSILTAYRVQEPVRIIRLDVHSLFEESFQLLSDFKAENFQDIYNKIAVRILEMVQLLYSRNRNDDNTEDNMALKIRKYLDANVENDISLQSVAEYCNYSKTHVISIFREKYRMTPMKYLAFKRIETACEMLAESEMPVTRIAQSLHYSDEKHFAHVFKAYKGISPSAFRRQSEESETHERMS